MVREGDLIFLKIKFFQGAPVSAAASVGPGRCPPGTRPPLVPPRARLTLVRRFILCFLEAGFASPYGGPLRASGTLPSGRSPLPRPSILDGAHWAPGPEPAGETVSRRWRDGRGFFPKDSHPLPPPVVTVCAGSRLATTGGGDYSIHLISKGAMVASGDRPSPTEAAAETKLPL